MKLSFVIPVFKTERYLARCLDSLAAQTDGDFEAIVVDDCSPGEAGRSEIAPYRLGANPSGSSNPSDQAEVGADLGAARYEAQEIVSRYDARFRYVRQDRNRSTFQAKATGAKMATGDYIVPLDSDDYVLPRLVEELKKGIGGENRWRWTKDVQPSTFNLQPDVVVYQMAKEFRGKVYPVKYNHPAGHCTGAEALEKLFVGRIFMPVCGKAIRREVFLAAYEGLGVGPDFYLNFTDDLCWLIPILLNTKTVAFIDYPGYRYWRHDDSMTKDVMAPEKVRLLAEQSQRSLATVVAYAERLGVAEQTVSAIRAQIYPTIRWLMRDMNQSRALLEEVYGADLVAETLRWDAASGGKLSKLLRHFRTYGLAGTIREVVAQLRHEEI